jgi:hypothetical protein
MTQLSETLKRIAKRLQMPQSFILREAIRHYKPYAGQLSTRERKQRIDLFDQLIATIPSRPASETDTELRAQRLSRVGSAGLRPGDDPSRYPLGGSTHSWCERLGPRTPFGVRSS